VLTRGGWFLLKHEFVSKELQPVLEVGNDSVRGPPDTVTIEVLTQRGACIRLHILLLEQGDNESVSSLVVHTCYIGVVQKSLREYLFEDLRLHMVFKDALEDLEFGVFSLTLHVINKIGSHKLLKGSKHEHSFCLFM
jgi:hypothetical protein